MNLKGDPAKTAEPARIEDANMERGISTI